MATAQSNGAKPLTDIELHAALKRFEPEYKEDSPLTDDQRQIRIKRLQKYQKKEEEEREKQARKREKDALKKGKDSQKSVGLRSPEVNSVENRSNDTKSAGRAAENRAAKRMSAEVESQNRLKRASLGVRSMEVRAAEINSQSVLVEPEAKKGRGGKRKSVLPEGNVTLQLTPSKVAGPSAVRTETVIQSPANSKKASTSSSNAACIEVTIRDVTLGEAANNLDVSLYGLDIAKSWKLLAQRSTTANGECPGLITNDLFEKGLYKLHFDTGAYFQSCNIVPLFPCVEVMFEVVDQSKTYHLHIDLGPYSYTTSISN